MTLALRMFRKVMATLAAAAIALAACVAAAAMASNAAAAQDAPLVSLDSWGKSRGWEAVGVLELEGNRRCTGTLIAPDHVLTAAHCVHDPATGKKTPASSIVFNAGWRDGRSVAKRRVTAWVIPEGYADAVAQTARQISLDLALLRLDAPIPATHADPYITDGAIRPGETVSVVSYGAGRFDAPSRQRACDVTRAYGAVKALTCKAVQGSSGSPVFALRGPRPRIVAVVSAIAQSDQGQITYAMDVEHLVPRLKARLAAGRSMPMASRNDTAVRRITVGGPKSASGARFVKP